MKDFTVGDIIDAEKTEIFQKDSKDPFIKKCRQREDGLKDALQSCGEIVFHHINKPGLDSANLRFWKIEKCKKCLANLCVYLEEICLELNKENIESYCTKMSPWQQPFELDLIFLIHNSYYGTVINDILWARDLSVNEAIKISTGKQDPNTLSKKLPETLKEVKLKLLLYLKTSKKYRRHASTIQEALNCYEKKYYKAFNLLVMTAIEGIVRDLAVFLSKKQGLEIDVSKYHSLDLLMRKPEWKMDYEIYPTQKDLILGQNKTAKSRASLGEAKLDEKVLVTVKERLDFLRRKFKEDRDLIVHGENHDYGKGIHLFMNVSALLHVYEVILYYNLQYRGKRDYVSWLANKLKNNRKK